MSILRTSALALVTLLACAGIAAAATIDLTGTIRDFKISHPDFEDYSGSDPGIVETTLGVDKKPVYAGLVGNPTTTSGADFDQWYRDVAGVNMSTPLTITLDNTITPDPDVYTYSNGSFFPIDGLLFGNEGNVHNYHFTFELHTEFTYLGGETFSFVGDDDLWVFIDDELVIDLGGVHGAMGASVTLDTLGLTIGNSYDLDLFFAERHTTASSFRIDTSLILSTPSSVPLPAGFLAGVPVLGVLAVVRRVRRRA